MKKRIKKFAILATIIVIVIAIIVFSDSKKAKVEYTTAQASIST